VCNEKVPDICRYPAGQLLPAALSVKLPLHQGDCLPRTRIVVTIAGLLLLAHIGVVAFLGPTARGATFSDLIQLLLGVVLIFTVVQAARRSEGFARSFWRLTVAAYAAWFVAQSLSFYNDFAASPSIAWANNLLFCFWFAPMVMALFLDPEHEAGVLDALTALDFAQAVLVCIAAYLYFFYLPNAESPGELAHEVWAPYFGGYVFIIASFLLRAAVAHSRDAKILFRRIGLFLALAATIDALYYYGPGRRLHSGSWFDLLWSIGLIVPTFIAVTWKQTEVAELAPEEPARENKIYRELFYLVYPLLVLFMSLRIARERLGLAAAVVFFAFVCSSARLLVTQHRLLIAKEALRREAAHDGLTGLWNRKSILTILDRELQRAERDREPVGLIMIDVDHFKAINDSRGHAAGDTVLRIIASGIAAMVRPYDSVGRYGGEEFLIVAPNCGISETWDLAERVRSHVASTNIMVEGPTGQPAAVQVSLSLGVTTGESSTEIEKLLQAADTALYVAKNTGRNRVAPNIGRAASAGQGSSSSTPKSDFWL
jgi:diguanylate cyclase (GGDEF)-like protein